ncbi:MAG TPA: HD domain-containing protein [Candidatus Paceibacterota bacterium]|nr:HD domain-containing protein [Candidatus Paceibacterota bacterium]
MTDSAKIKLNVPREILEVTKTLQNKHVVRPGKGFLAYLVGGCVRDSLIGREPKDWDITTNATPEEIIPLFPKTVYENVFGTVTIVNEETTNDKLKNVEVTPFRTEANYSDRRHPDEVKFSDKLEDDLSRRDFTINALAYDPKTEELIDLYGGIKDIKDHVIRTVGEADERFSEDALRMLRAIRLASELRFTCNKEVLDSISRNKALIKDISIERVRDEFLKIIDSPEPMAGLIISHETGLLEYILPELERSIGVEQKGEHIYDVWEHTLRALQHSADRGYPLHVKLAALLHDIGKPKTQRKGLKNKEFTFYGHEVVGERMAINIMSRLKLPNKLADLVIKLVRNHMFFADPDKITLSAVRRVIANVGPEHIWDLMNLRICDRIGMGRPKEEPYRLRKYESMIEEALRAPTSVGMLKIDGKHIMDVTRETPGPKIGYILNALLEEALENPEINNVKYLEKRALELAKLDGKTLKELAEKGKSKKEEIEEAEIKKIRSKYKVK